MFGKGKRIKSSNEKFIIGKGIDAGNLKGRGTSAKTAPMAAKSSFAVPEGTLYNERKTKTMSKGKAGPVKLTGD